MEEHGTALSSSPSAEGRAAQPSDGDLQRPPPRRNPGLRPALFVVGLAAFILVLFGVGSVLTGGTPPSAPRGTAAAQPTKVKGSTLLAVPAAARLAPIRVGQTPPADIVDHVTLPQGARTVSSSPSTTTTEFSATMRFEMAASQGAIVGFYRADLATQGWNVFSSGPARGHPDAVEVLGRKAGSDGWYWEIGVVVSPTTFGRAEKSSTSFSVQLFEVADAA